MIASKHYSYNAKWANIVQSLEKGEAKTFNFSNNNEYFSFNYIKRDIAHEINTLEANSYFDFITPFDYGAFFYTDKNILEDALEAFENHCNEEKIISGFFRFNPLLEQDFSKIGNFLEVIRLQEHIYIDLQTDFKSFFSNRKKRNIKRAKRLNFNFIVDDNIDNFYPIYLESMQRVGANEYFMFNKEVLQSLLAFGKIFSLQDENKTISSIFVIEEEHNVYYFLGGTQSDYLSTGVNSLLFELTSEYYKTSKILFLIGGGADSLYQYKKEFSNKSTPFYIGKKIYNKEIYDMLAKKVEQENNSFFPAYRKKII